MIGLPTGDALAVSIFRLSGAVIAVLIVAVVVLPGAEPAGAAPLRAPACPSTRAQLAWQHVTSATGLPDLTCADLRNATFDGVDLVQANLAGADAQGASFRHAHLIQADFTGADLRGAHFEHAALGQAQLVGVDARGAFFGHADLGQTDLDSSDLRGADFVHASLIQADLSDTNLTGSKIYWTESIQADVSDARIRLTDPGTFQVSLLAVLGGLLALVRSIVEVLRGRGLGNWLRRGAVRLAAYAAACGFVWLVAGMLFPLQFIVVAYPVLIGAGLVFLSGLVRGYTPKPRPFVPTPPYVVPAADLTDSD